MSHEHHDGCNCPTDPVEQARSLADFLRGKAQSFQNKDDAGIASALLAAARALLTGKCGGVHGETGVWLLAGEAHIPLLAGKLEDALAGFEAALALSEKEVGAEHFATGISLVNVADTLMSLNRPGQAAPLYDRAKTILKKAVDDIPIEKDEYLHGFVLAALKEADNGSRLAHEKLGG